MGCYFINAHALPNLEKAKAWSSLRLEEADFAFSQGDHRALTLEDQGTSCPKNQLCLQRDGDKDEDRTSQTWLDRRNIVRSYHVQHDAS